MRTKIIAAACLALALTVGCQEEAPPAPDATPGVSATGSATQAAEPSAITQGTAPSVASGQAGETTPPAPDKVPPAPPLFEDFQGEPQISLFPRVGDFRPADGSDRLPFWNTFIDHLVRITGVVEEQSSGNRAWLFRSIESIDSVGYFSPLAVTPKTTYRVSFWLAAELADGATAGVGILEFDEFLWIGEQYSEETYKQHFRGSQEGQRLKGKIKGDRNFTFTTGPETRMIHLVLFREGPGDRNGLVFDNIRIETAGK